MFIITTCETEEGPYTNFIRMKQVRQLIDKTCQYTPMLHFSSCLYLEEKL